MPQPKIYKTQLPERPTKTYTRRQSGLTPREICMLHLTAGRDAPTKIGGDIPSGRLDGANPSYTGIYIYIYICKVIFLLGLPYDIQLTLLGHLLQLGPYRHVGSDPIRRLKVKAGIRPGRTAMTNSSTRPTSRDRYRAERLHVDTLPFGFPAFRRVCFTTRTVGSRLLTPISTSRRALQPR